VKHPAPAVWSSTRECAPDIDTPTHPSPRQLDLFETAADSSARTSDAHAASGKRLVATSEQPGAAALPLAPGLETVELTSDDGVLRFRLVGSATGVVVKRTHHQSCHERVDVSMAFVSEASLSQWCAADPLRYTYPLLFAQLRRSGRALFNRCD